MSYRRALMMRRGMMMTKRRKPIPVILDEASSDDFVIRRPDGEIIWRGNWDGNPVFTTSEDQCSENILLNTSDSPTRKGVAPEQAFSRRGQIAYFLAFLVPSKHRTAVIGDMLEEYAEIERQHGTSAAMRLCAWDCIRSIVRLAVIAKIVHWFSQWAR